MARKPYDYSYIPFKRAFDVALKNLTDLEKAKPELTKKYRLSMLGVIHWGLGLTYKVGKLDCVDEKIRHILKNIDADKDFYLTYLKAVREALFNFLVLIQEHFDLRVRRFVWYREKDPLKDATYDLTIAVVLLDKLIQKDEYIYNFFSNLSLHIFMFAFGRPSYFLDIIELEIREMDLYWGDRANFIAFSLSLIRAIDNIILIDSLKTKILKDNLKALAKLKTRKNRRLKIPRKVKDLSLTVVNLLILESLKTRRKIGKILRIRRFNRLYRKNKRKQLLKNLRYPMLEKLLRIKILTQV